MPSQGEIKNPLFPNILGNPGEQGGTQVVSTFIQSAISLGFIIGVLFFVLYFFMGAINWIMSGEDKQKMESARNRVTHAIIGLIVLFALFAIIRLFEGFFGITILNINFEQLRLTPSAAGP